MSVFEMSILLIATFLAMTIVWTTLRVGISPMPSSAKAYRAMLTLTEDTGDGAIYDLGSGWGTLVIRMAIKYPKRKIIGYEISLLPYLVSVLIKFILRVDNLTLYRQDFMKVDLSGASVLLCYLYPDGMSKLASLIHVPAKNESCSSSVSAASQLDPKPLSHMSDAQCGCHPDFIISNNFAFPSLKAEQDIRLDDIYSSPIYRYKLKSSVS
ncbi:class I SAM-dependent methyltransferase [Shewanella sp. VB17]|uniref:class I SAM-dependent methyltransferase n=1 Tax=Shewanella sp. VB17 TaxID=2739432 RepID=UPI0015670CA7|nr:class I SAM-dependent methyltransferase [Shewanella sp. VB17]NRD74810.1 class I SAM-dependent methyltransferase [Shewanella sp. VB17]